MRNQNIVDLTIELLKKESIDITPNNIKIWQTESMLAKNVLLGCDYIKREKLSPVLVYTNKVPMKKYIQDNEGIRIIDVDDLAIWAIRHRSDLLKYLSV